MWVDEESRSRSDGGQELNSSASLPSVSSDSFLRQPSNTENLPALIVNLPAFFGPRTPFEMQPRYSKFNECNEVVKGQSSSSINLQNREEEAEVQRGEWRERRKN